MARVAQAARGARFRRAPSRVQPGRRLLELWPALLRDKRMLLGAGLILTYIWRFHDLTPGLARLRVAAVCTVLSWVVLALSPAWPRLRDGIRRPYAAAFLFWCFWIVAGASVSIAPQNTWDFILQTQYKNVLFFLFLLSTLWGLKRIKLALMANVAGAFVLAFFYVKGGTPGWGTPVPMYDVNDLALLMDMTLPMAVWAAISYGRKRWEKIALWSVVLVMILAVTGTGSRGGFLGMATVVLFMLFRFRAVPRAAKVSLVLGVGILLMVAPDSYWARISTILHPTEDYNYNSDLGRIEIWKRGWAYTLDHPVLGLGAQNFPIAECTLRPEALTGQNVKCSATHSSYMQSLAETGFLGFALWLGMFAGALARIQALRRRLRVVEPINRLEGVRLLDTLTACFMGYAVAGFFLSQAYTPYILVLLAMLAGVEGWVQILIRGQLQSRRPDGAPAVRGRPAMRRPHPIPAARMT